MIIPIPLMAVIAFVGGGLSFLSPCTAVILPGYFAYTFQENVKMLKASILYALGLSIIYIPLGLGVTTVTKLLAPNITFVSWIIGISFISFGLITLFGKYITIQIFDTIQNTFRLHDHGKNTTPLFLGFITGLGSTPCAGPILGAILTMAATTQNIALGAFLMFLYVVGIFTPLVLFSFLLKKNTTTRSLLVGKIFTFTIRNKEYKFQSTQLISGSLFLILGMFFLILGNGDALGSFFTTTGLFDITLDLQDALLELFVN